MTEDKLATVSKERAQQLTALFQSTEADLLITAASASTVSGLANLSAGWGQITPMPRPSSATPTSRTTPIPRASGICSDPRKLNTGITYDMAHGHERSRASVPRCTRTAMATS